MSIERNRKRLAIPHSNVEESLSGLKLFPKAFVVVVVVVVLFYVACQTKRSIEVKATWSTTEQEANLAI